MKIRNILLILGLLGLAVVVILNLHDLSSFVKLIRHIRIYIAIIAVLAQLLSYYLNGLYYRSILRIFGHEIHVTRLFQGAMAANFVNYVAPTAGMAGAAFLSQVLKPEVPRGEGFLTQVMRYALSALAVLIMMPVGIMLVVLGNKSSHGIDKVAISSAAIIVVASIVIVAFVHQEKQLRRFVNWLGKIGQKYTKKIKQATINEFAKDFYIGYHKMDQKKRGMLIPFGWSIIYIVVEIGTLYLSFLAFGKVVNPGIVVMGYLLANIASTFGGAFISTGVFELGMIGTFSALGLPFALSLSVTLFYRILNLLIGLPAGFYFYHKYLEKKT